MYRFPKELVALSGVILCLECCKAQQNQNASRAFETQPRPELESWTKIPSKDFTMADPPTENDGTFNNDFEKLKELQNIREPIAEKRGLHEVSDPCKLARKQRFPTFKAFFGPTANILSEEEFEKAEPILDQVSTFTERVAGYYKDKYERARPFTTDPSIIPCVTRPVGKKSYPSSHAAVATADACILAKIYPQYAPNLEALGSYLGNLRAIVGVHHPSDIAAGQILGRSICERLFKEPSFRNDIQPLLEQRMP